MREPLLTLHILSVIIWLGCGLYEIFLAHEIKLSRGTVLELNLVKIYIKYSAAVPVATLLVAGTGVTMTIVLNWGFFTYIWLGTKQTLMIGVLIIFASVVPPFYRLSAIVESLPAGATILPKEAADLFCGLEPWLIVMRVLGAIAVGLAVFKPGLQ